MPSCREPALFPGNSCAPALIEGIWAMRPRLVEAWNMPGDAASIEGRSAPEPTEDSQKSTAAMETHPQKAEDMPIGSGDLADVVRTIDPIIVELIDGAVKGALHADDLVDIAVRIRSILHRAAAEQRAGAGRAAGSGAGARDAALVSGAGG